MKKEKGFPLIEVLYVLFIVAMLVFGGYSIYRNVTLGANASDWKKGCLPNGQSVWVANYLAKGFAVLNVDASGDAVECIPR